MYAPSETQLAAQLDQIVDRIQQIRQLDLSLESNLQHALSESRDTLGALACYRSLLSRAADYGRVSQRRAA